MNFASLPRRGGSTKSATTYGEISLASVFGVSSNIERIEGSKQL